MPLNLSPKSEPNFNDPLVGATLDKCGIVLPRGALGSWDAGMVEGPSIWYDTNRKEWGMSYHADESLKDKFIRPEVNIGFSIVAAK